MTTLSLSLSTPITLPPLLNAPHMTLLHHVTRRRLFSVSAAALRQDAVVFASSPLTSIHRAAESLFHVTVNVSEEVALSHTLPGQYLQLRLPNTDKPAFLAIASAPKVAEERGEMEFLVKAVEGSTAEAVCGLRKGDLVEVTRAMGKGFGIDLISPAEDYPTVLIFATGSGISPIRSLIETGFDAGKRPDVRLYYGARNLRRMAYQDRFKEWEASGVKIVPVLSQPDDNWSGERGYVQAAFARAKETNSPQGTGVVLCGQKQMAEEVTSLLTANGVPSEKILTNF